MKIIRLLLYVHPVLRGHKHTVRLLIPVHLHLQLPAPVPDLLILVPARQAVQEVQVAAVEEEDKGAIYIQGIK